MPNASALVSGLVVLVCAVLAVRRVMTRFSPTKVREDLTVSRGSLVEHQSKTGDDCELVSKYEPTTSIHADLKFASVPPADERALMDIESSRTRLSRLHHGYRVGEGA
jgi:hypothetical protein